jgi:hypothetical protein
VETEFSNAVISPHSRFSVMNLPDVSVIAKEAGIRKLGIENCFKSSEKILEILDFQTRTAHTGRIDIQGTTTAISVQSMLSWLESGSYSTHVRSICCITKEMAFPVDWDKVKSGDLQDIDQLEINLPADATSFSVDWERVRNGNVQYINSMKKNMETPRPIYFPK